MSNVRVYIPPPPDDRPVSTGEEPQQAMYDPGEYTVEEVKGYVEENPDQAEQVLAAEQEGKARVTLVDWLEELPPPEEEAPPEEAT